MSKIAANKPYMPPFHSAKALFTMQQNGAQRL